jgi:hypothetical protein
MLLESSLAWLAGSLSEIQGDTLTLAISNPLHCAHHSAIQGCPLGFLRLSAISQQLLFYAGQKLWNKV